MKLYELLNKLTGLPIDLEIMIPEKVGLQSVDNVIGAVIGEDNKRNAILLYNEDEHEDIINEFYSKENQPLG